MIALLRQRFWNYYYIVITGGASILTGTINYLYHPLMIRYLDGADFAMFQSLMSLFNIFGVIGAWLGYYLTQQVSMHAHSNSYLIYIKNFWLRYATYRWFALFLLFCAVSPLIAIYLHLPSIYLVFLVAASYLVAGYSIVYGALLQGNHKFEHIAWVMIWWALWRIWLWAGAIALDRWVPGAIAAVSCASILAVWLQHLFTKQIGITTKEEIWEKPATDQLFNHTWTILFFVGASFLTMLLTQIDIFIVQHKFFWEQAGNYVAVSVLAKFVFFLAASIETVYFPQLAKKTAKNVSYLQLRNYFILLILLIGVSVWWAWLLWTQVLYLFKAHLIAYNGWLQPLIIASGALFFFTTIFKLLISRQEFIRAYILIGIWVVSMIWLHVMSNSLESFVSLYMWAMLSLCWWALICLLSTFLKNKEHHSISI